MKIKNHQRPDTSKHIQAQKFDASHRKEHNNAKIEKATDKALHQRDASANLAKVDPSERNH